MFIGVSQLVSLFVCQFVSQIQLVYLHLDYVKTTQLISTKLGGKVESGPRKEWLDFDGIRLDRVTLGLGWVGFRVTLGYGWVGFRITLGYACVSTSRTQGLYRYISVRQPSADNSSSLGSKLISSNAPTCGFFLRELLMSVLTYLLRLGFGRVISRDIGGHVLSSVSLENLLFAMNGSEIKKKKRSITNCRL